MARSNIDGAVISDSILMSENRFGMGVQTLTATYAIPAGAEHIQVLDPGGSARNVTLPANPQPGDWFLIVNSADAAEVITVQNSAGAGLTPAITPTQSESALVIYVNATLGWRGSVTLGA